MYIIFRILNGKKRSLKENLHWIRQSQDQWKNNVRLEKDSNKNKNMSIYHLTKLLQEKEMEIQNMFKIQKNELEQFKGFIYSNLIQFFNKCNFR